MKREAEREGLDEIFRAAGADWREAGCSMCIAMNGDQLTPGQYAISTTNRNFEGRQGKGGRTFLASPLTAAASAHHRRRHRPADAARASRRLAGDRRSLTMAEPFRMFTSTVIPLPAENVDTDQIVPARYLKVTDKEGLAEALFRDWRFEEDGSLKDPPFVLDQPGMAGRAILLVGRQLRRRLVARARAVGARAPGAIRAILSTSLRRHLPQQQPQERRCCRSSSRPPAPRATSSIVAADPDAELTVDLAEAGVLLPDGSTIEFEIDPFAKRMLLAGTDELGYLLSKESEIVAWEAAHPPRIDTLAAS